MPLPTTRRARFLYRRARYLKRLRRWEDYKWVWGRDAAGKRIKLGLKGLSVLGPKQGACGVSSASYDATPKDITSYGLRSVVTADGYGSPPHVRFQHPGYLRARADGYHQRGALYGFHLKRVTAVRRLALAPQTAATRKEYAAWVFWRKYGRWPAWDPLGRQPA